MVDDNNKCYSLEPELKNIMKKSRDYDRLLWAWKGWREATGRKMRFNFTQTVEINTKGSRENGYSDLGEFWRMDYDVKNLEKIYDQLFHEIRPLYKELHSYVKRKLKQFYGDNYPKNHNPKLIPAHILGNFRF